MTMNQTNPENQTRKLLHDGVSPYTYLGVFYLKKFLDLCPPEMLSEAQENTLFLSFINMQKASENIHKLMEYDAVEEAGEELFFPTVEDLVKHYGLDKIVLENSIHNMSSTVGKRIGICLFELVLNQTKHNSFSKATITLSESSKTIYARIVFCGVSEDLPPQSDQLGVKLGMKLMQKRLDKWGASLNSETNKTKQTICWQLELPNTIS